MSDDKLPHGQVTRIVGDPTVVLLYGLEDAVGNYIIKPGTTCRIATLYFCEDHFGVDVYHPETGEVYSIEEERAFGRTNFRIRGKLDDGKDSHFFPSVVVTQVFNRLFEELGRQPDGFELEQAASEELRRCGGW
jgi:hypothetical protein